MANVTETSLWENGIYQIEETDVVRGGDPQAGGISNVQAQQLANRTVWLKENLQLNRQPVIKNVTANFTLGAAELLNTHVLFNITQAAKVCTLNLTNIPDNTVMSFSTITDNGLAKVLKIAAPVPILGTQKNEFSNNFYLYSGEMVTLLYSGDNLYIIDGNVNNDTVGEVIYKYTPPYLSVPADGTLLNRAEYPRLWQYVNNYCSPITDALWIMAPPTNMIKNRGLFSTGNGTTTFRVPDLRGLFIRALDRGRGMDPDRVPNGEQSGSFQDQSVMHHTHSYMDIYYSEAWGQVPVPGNFGSNKSDNDNSGHQMERQTGTNQHQANETRPRNIAISAFIKI